MPSPNWLGFGSAGGAAGLGFVTAASRGVVGNGSTDCAAVLQAIHDSLPTGGLVVLPAGKIVCNTRLALRNPITWVGQGTSTDWFNTADAPWAPATELLRTAVGSGGGLIHIGTSTGTIVGGISIYNLGLDCAALVPVAVLIERAQGCVLSNVGIRRPTVQGLTILGTNLPANVSIIHNRFESVHIRAPTGVSMTGNAGHTGNCSHNTFVDLYCQYSGTRGLYIADGDNNTFIGTRIFREAGTGVGVELGTRARSNYFFHLEAGAGGLKVDTPAVAGKSNLVVGYDVENGQPLPTLATGAFLDYTVTGVASTWNLGSYLIAPNKSVKVTGAHTVQPTEDIIYGTGTFTVSPPTVLRAGRTYTVKNVGAGTITVGSGGHNIDGSASVTLAAATKKSVTIQFDGTTFNIIASH